MCDPAWGIGSNGLLFGPQATDSTRFGLRIINSDGTPAGFSGNGVRIFAKYLLDIGDVKAGQGFNIETIEDDVSGLLARHRIPVRIEGHDGSDIEVCVPHRPDFGPEAVGARTSHGIEASGTGSAHSYSVSKLVEIGARFTGSKAWDSSTFVAIGNPHCVTFVDVDEQMPNSDVFKTFHDEFRALSFRPLPEARAGAIFENGVNLQWVRVKNRSCIQLVIYERGEGPTLASGSSAIAAAAAAFARGLVDQKIDVLMQGGMLRIQIYGIPDNIERVTLVGTATRIFDGWVENASLRSQPG